MEVQYSKQGLLGHTAVKQATIGGLVPAERILILAPHHDDEAIGCGGTILRYLKTGTQIEVIYLTDGRYGILGEKAEIRELEACEAWKDYNIKQVFLRHEDSHLSDSQAAEQLIEYIRESRPDIIFTPWLLDQHVDHQYTTYFLKDALNRIEDNQMLICQYEVMCPLYTNLMINITKEFEEKLDILERFTSQVSFLDIKEIARSINEYRGRSMHFKRIRQAEAFYISNKEDYIQLIEKLINVFNR